MSPACSAELGREALLSGTCFYFTSVLSVIHGNLSGFLVIGSPVNLYCPLNSTLCSVKGCVILVVMLSPVLRAEFVHLYNTLLLWNSRQFLRDFFKVQAIKVNK